MLLLKLFFLYFSQKLTKILESVGARVAPLSKESRFDLERLEELQRKLQNNTKLATSSSSVPNLFTLHDESSIILEHSKGLVSKQEANITHDDDNYGDEDVGLQLKGDPLLIHY